MYKKLILSLILLSVMPFLMAREKVIWENDSWELIARPRRRTTTIYSVRTKEPAVLLAVGTNEIIGRSGRFSMNCNQDEKYHGKYDRWVNFTFTDNLVLDYFLGSNFYLDTGLLNLEDDRESKEERFKFVSGSNHLSSSGEIMGKLYGQFDVIKFAVQFKDDPFAADTIASFAITGVEKAKKQLLNSCFQSIG